MFEIANDLIKKALDLEQKLKIGVIHPCSDYALLGAVSIQEKSLATPILIGPQEKITTIANKNNICIDNFEIIDVPHSHAAVDKAIELVKNNQLQLLMKGSLHTDELMYPILNSKTGIKTDKRVTHCCVLDIPDFNRPLLVADIAINIAPSLDVKVDITQNAINLAHAIGLNDIKVAILSAEEQVHTVMPSSVEAAVISKMSERGQIVGAIIDGPLSFDTAISEAASNIKNLNSKVAGRADILVAPTIEAANAIVKQFKYFTKAIMPGIAIGAQVPIILTSRADDPFTRLTSCALGSLYSKWYQSYLKEKNEYFNP